MKHELPVDSLRTLSWKHRSGIVGYSLQAIEVDGVIILTVPQQILILAQMVSTSRWMEDHQSVKINRVREMIFQLKCGWGSLNFDNPNVSGNLLF